MGFEELFTALFTEGETAIGAAQREGVAPRGADLAGAQEHAVERILAGGMQKKQLFVPFHLSV
jgi:hypothetical protein